MTIIDADSHLFERPDVWRTYAAPSQRDMALAMAVMLVGTLAWGLIAMSNAPQVFGQADGYLGVSNAIMWALTVAVMAFATLVAAGAVVPEGTEVPAESMVMGVPAKVKRPLTADERERFRQNAQHYVEAARIYKDDR